MARGTCEATVCGALGASKKVQTGQEKPDASIATVTSMKIDEAWVAAQVKEPQVR